MSHGGRRLQETELSLEAHVGKSRQLRNPGVDGEKCERARHPNDHKRYSPREHIADKCPHRNSQQCRHRHPCYHIGNRAHLLARSCEFSSHDCSNSKVGSVGETR